jgi:hypothetical protein
MAVVRIPANTPIAAWGEGRRRRVLVVTAGVLGDAVHVGHRGAAVDGGDVAPLSCSMHRPKASNSAARLSTWAGRMITALPPPTGKPASAAL